MKTILNKKVMLLQKETTYAELLSACNDVVPDKGWTPQEQKKALRVDTAIEKAGETIELEDADFEYIKPKVSSMPWAIKDKVLVEFTDYIEGL